MTGVVLLHPAAAPVEPGAGCLRIPELGVGQCEEKVVEGGPAAGLRGRSPQGLDRRTAIKWMLTAAASTSLLGPAGRAQAAAAEATPVNAQGYGTDPDLRKTYKPGDVWPLTMTDAQRRTAAALCGTIIPAGELHSLDQVRGKHAIVLGYGKSACDITVEVAKEAASTTVVARELLWKMPRKVKNVLNYKYLMLTRLGEGLFRYHTVNGAEKVLHARDSALANNMLGSVEKVTTEQLESAEQATAQDAPTGIGGPTPVPADTFVAPPADAALPAETIPLTDTTGLSPWQEGQPAGASGRLND